VDAAVKAAARAFPKWARLSGHERAKYLYALARLLQKHSRLFAVLESLDNGKPIREARDIDVPLAQRHFYYHAGLAQLLAEELPDKPLGVCGQIIPWNFPLLMLAWKIAPALAAGNTVVLKPAEYTSLTALLFADICREAGLPKGVVNIVTGDGATGQAIVEHPGIAKIAFTGSTAVGRRIRETTAGTGKSLTLELGGKSPYIVFDDADIDSAIEGLVDAIWFNQGQVCCAGSRLFVQEGIAEDFHTRLKARMDKLRVGDPLDKCIDVGAVVDPVQHAAITRMVDANTEGEVYRAATDNAGDGLLLPADADHRAFPRRTADAGRDLRPRPRLRHLPHAGGGRATGQQHALRARRDPLDREPEPRPRHRAEACRRGGLGERHQPFRRRRPLRRDARKRFRARRRMGGHAGLPETRHRAETRQTGRPRAPARDRRCPGLDRTAKMYVGGKQARPDGGYSQPSIRANAASFSAMPGSATARISATRWRPRAGAGWAKATGHLRAQILYYIAENLSARADEFAARIHDLTGTTAARAEAEVAPPSTGCSPTRPGPTSSTAWRNRSRSGAWRWPCANPWA
jgi:aldehyde dehydrogenase (NAD+)